MILFTPPSVAMISRCLLLGLLVLACLQSFTTAQSQNGPESCCFEFQKTPIPLQFTDTYTETRLECTHPGVIFFLKNGRRVCANPAVAWVQKLMKKIDLHLYASPTQPQQRS